MKAKYRLKTVRLIRMSEVFAAICESSGKTQDELSKTIGTTQQYLQKFLSGRGSMREEFLIKLADLFNICEQYVTFKSVYPFRPGCLLKLFIREKSMLYNLEPLFSILNSSASGDLVFLFRPSPSIKEFTKKKRISRHLRKAVMALIVRTSGDGINHAYFALRKKNAGEPILFSGDFRRAFTRIIEISGIESRFVSWGQEEITESLWEKLTEWNSLELADVESIFQSVQLSPVKFVSEKQEQLIRDLEKEGIDSISFEETMLIKVMRNYGWDPYGVMKSLKLKGSRRVHDK